MDSTPSAAFAASTTVSKEEDQQHQLPPQSPQQQHKWQHRLAPPKSAEYYKALRIASVTKSQNEDYKRENNRNNKHKLMYIYRACCGLGHRLLRQASSYRWARDAGHPHVWVEWNKKLVPMCGLSRDPSVLDLFEYFFGPGPMVLLHDEKEADLDDYGEVLDSVAVGVNTVDNTVGASTSTAGASTSTVTVEDRVAAMDRQLEQKTLEALAAANVGVNTSNTNDYDYDLSRIQKGKNLYAVQTVTRGWSGVELHKNGPPGYHKTCLTRQTKHQLLDQGILDDRFYRQLKASFLFRDRVEAFASEHRFSERLVLGIHVRAGNGETGDFVHKNRGIGDIDRWVLEMAKTMDALIRNIQSAQQQQQQDRVAAALNNNNTNSSSSSSSPPLPPLLFVATDDISVVAKLANATQTYNIRTVSLPQVRLETGAGVTYFAQNQGHDRCREGWLSQIADSMLLGAADVVVAARYSSFSQSLPLVSVLSGSIRERKRKRNNGDDEGATRTDTASTSNNADINRDATTNTNNNNNTGSVDGTETNKNETTTNDTKTTNTNHRFARRLFCEGSRYGNGIRCYDDYLDWILAVNQLYVPSAGVFHDRAELAVYYQKEVMGLCNTNQDTNGNPDTDTAKEVDAAVVLDVPADTNTAQHNSNDSNTINTTVSSLITTNTTTETATTTTTL